jgi:hypothetical protein
VGGDRYAVRGEKFVSLRLQEISTFLNGSPQGKCHDDSLSEEVAQGLNSTFRSREDRDTFSVKEQSLLPLHLCPAEVDHELEGVPTDHL